MTRIHHLPAVRPELMVAAACSQCFCDICLVSLAETLRPPPGGLRILFRRKDDGQGPTLRNVDAFLTVP